MVAVAAFNHQSPVLGILSFAVPGAAFVIGWVKFRQWRILPVMAAWSVLIAIPVALVILIYSDFAP